MDFTVIGRVASRSINKGWRDTPLADNGCGDTPLASCSSEGRPHSNPDRTRDPAKTGERREINPEPACTRVESERNIW